jgi:hypothetical protein
MVPGTQHPLSEISHSLLDRLGSGRYATTNITQPTHTFQSMQVARKYVHIHTEILEIEVLPYLGGAYEPLSNMPF